MVYGAIKGMVAALDDPYTSFLTPKTPNNLLKIPTDLLKV